MIDKLLQLPGFYHLARLSLVGFCLVCVLPLLVALAVTVSSLQSARPVDIPAPSVNSVNVGHSAADFQQIARSLAQLRLAAWSEMAHGLAQQQAVSAVGVEDSMDWLQQVFDMYRVSVTHSAASLTAGGDWQITLKLDGPAAGVAGSLALIVQPGLPFRLDFLQLIEVAQQGRLYAELVMQLPQVLNSTGQALPSLFPHQIIRHAGTLTVNGRSRRLVSGAQRQLWFEETE